MKQMLQKIQNVAISQKTFLILVLVMLAGGAAFDLAYAEVTLTDEQTLQLIGVGAFAALFKAYIGYTKAKEDFDKIKFFDGFLTAAITTIPIALGAAYTNTTFNIFGLVMIFFTTIGAGWTISELRKKSVPSNAA